MVLHAPEPMANNANQLGIAFLMNLDLLWESAKQGFEQPFQLFRADSWDETYSLPNLTGKP